LLICDDRSVTVPFLNVGMLEVGTLDGHVVFGAEGSLVVGQSIVVLGQH
jgi:hypothetical protein